jgi:5-methylthioadenosine/S-adenosylhomocysteine deaminase
MYVIKNAMIVTMDPRRNYYRNGNIWIDADRIIKIGPADEVGLPEGNYETFDATDKIAIPGFVSVHNHLYSAVVRSLPYGGPTEETDSTFISWIERFWFQYLEDRVTEEQLYAGTLVNCLDNIRSGITTTAYTVEGTRALPDVLDAVDQALVESGIRANIRYFEKTKKRGGRVEGVFNVHTTFTCSTELLQAVASEARKRGSRRIQMHCSDDYFHSFDTTRRFGKRSAKYLEDIGFLGPDVLLAHCAYMDEFKDPPLFAQYGVNIAHNAESSAIFGFNPNMARFWEAGVTVGLGLDGMKHSMFEVMRTSQMLHRLRYYNMSFWPDDQLMEMATMKGAQALGLADQVGSLAKKRISRSWTTAGRYPSLRKTSTTI